MGGGVGVISSVGIGVGIGLSSAKDSVLAGGSASGTSVNSGVELGKGDNSGGLANGSEAELITDC